MLVDADPFGGVEPGRQRGELFDGALAKGLRETPVGRRTWLPVEEQLIPDVALLCVQLRHVRSVRPGCDIHADCARGRRRAWWTSRASRSVVCRGRCTTSYQVKRPTSHPVAATTAVSRRAS